MFGRFALRHHSLAKKIREAIGVREKFFVQPYILGVCGGSGSGKTTFCEKLVSLLGADRVAHLRQDDYYRDLSHLDADTRARVNFDHPESIEFGLLAMHLDHLVQGLDVAVPKYDFASHTRTRIQQIVSPKPVVLVEGILLFADASTSSRIHHKIFIETSEEVRFARRLRRDVRDRGRTPESVEWQFSSTVKPMHNLYVEPKKLLADRVISGENPFEPALVELSSVLMRNALMR
jgi:uridine kinase